MMFANFWTPRGTDLVKRYVASLDVLGFKQRLASKGLTELFSEYKALQVYLKETGTKFTVLGTLFGQTVGVQKQAPYVFMSDTIMLWCDEEGDTDSFVSVCGSLIADSVRRGLFLRGAIAFGETIIDPPSMTFLGQPIVDAYLAETSQEWVGLAVHSTAVAGLGQAEDVVTYPVPTKADSPSLSSAVTWHHYLTQDDAVAQLEKAKAVAGSSAPKYEAAIKFVRAYPPEE